MNSQIAPNPLSFAPEVHRDSALVGRLPAAVGAAQKFEQLMYAPASATHAAANAATSAIDRSGMKHYIEGLSRRWEAGQTALKRMTDAGEYTSKELIQTQLQMINCALDVEVSSKCASMFENGVQTLVQRGS